jgi:hypothetical protein
LLQVHGVDTADKAVDALLHQSLEMEWVDPLLQGVLFPHLDEIVVFNSLDGFVDVKRSQRIGLNLLLP